MDIGRDLVLVGGGSSGTPLALARVESDDALAQSVELALTTALGSDVFDTSFGFDGVNALAEESDPLLARERVRISVIKLLQAEPRVRRILDVDLGGDRLGTPASGLRALDVTVVFETAASEQATIQLGSVPRG